MVCVLMFQHNQERRLYSQRYLYCRLIVVNNTVNLLMKQAEGVRISYNIT